METSNETTTIRDGACTIVVDAKHWPVVFATWFDEPTEAAVGRYFDAHDRLFVRARAAKEKFILVTDTASTKRPSAKVRKIIAERTESQPSDAIELTIASLIVVENALIRGVVTALTWIMPRMKDSETVGSISDAIERCFALLDAKGIARPASLSAARYRRPAA